MSKQEAPAHEQRMSLFEHLRELRSRLIKALVAIGLGGVVVWFLYESVFDVLINPYCDALVDNGQTLVTEGTDTGSGGCGAPLLVTDPLEGFATRLKVAGYGGLALAMPFVLWQIWRFVSPGLYPNERRYAIPFVASATLLFLLGAGLAFWTLPRALGFLISIGGPDLLTAYSPNRYLGLITYMMLAFGIGFEFPILLIFLQMAGILDVSSLRRFRRYAIVGIVVLVAVITPSGDPISLLALSIPMWLFYEAAIAFGWLRQRRRAREGTQHVK